MHTVTSILVFEKNTWCTCAWPTKKQSLSNLFSFHFIPAIFPPKKHPLKCHRLVTLSVSRRLTPNVRKPWQVMERTSAPPGQKKTIKNLRSSAQNMELINVKSCLLYFCWVIIYDHLWWQSHTKSGLKSTSCSSVKPAPKAITRLQLKSANRFFWGRCNTNKRNLWKWGEHPM